MALTQILTTDSVSASVVNAKIVGPANTAISGLQIAQTAGGTATAITLTGVELTNGYQKTFVISASNSGAATTINGKPLYKPGGTVAPNLVAGKASSIWYNLAGDCFFYKASAEGTAVAGDVLATKTFSNDDDTGLTGTLALTGDAAVGDVVSGKSFYNTDAKTKLTGTYSNIKSIQRGEYSIASNPATINISAIDTSKSIVRVTQRGYSLQQVLAKVSFQSATQIKLDFSTINSANGDIVSWEVIEFNDVKSLQTGLTSVNSNGTVNVAISDVNPLKSIVFITCSTLSVDVDATFLFTVRLTSATNIEFKRQNHSVTDTPISWRVIEFN